LLDFACGCVRFGRRAIAVLPKCDAECANVVNEIATQRH
jgi:hypothetical protein